MINSKIFLFGIILSVFSSSLFAGQELNYLNSLRVKTGMPPFSSEIHLDDAAINHSDYMQSNNASGHYEQSDKVGFTGASPSDRVGYANYSSAIIGENVSTGTRQTYQDSIDLLFAAIYHRYGFLNMTFSEIGIGSNDESNRHFYTYDLGNREVNKLCQDDVYDGGSYYSSVCKNANQKVASADFVKAININKSKTPKLIVWPAANIKDIPPVFNYETPDPLPNDSVTGYPISVEFNEGKFSKAPTINSFTIKETYSGKNVTRLTLMTSQNDPNSHLTKYQAAFFPKERLSWGTSYEATVEYTYKDKRYVYSWFFSIRTLRGISDKVYIIDKGSNSEITLKVISGKSYAFYLVPDNTNDKLGGMSAGGTANIESFSYIDTNTFMMKLSGEKGKYREVKVNGKKIKLIIDTVDTARIPKKEFKVHYVDTDNDGIPDTTDTDDDNDGISDINELRHGLDPLNASDAQADFDHDGFSNAIEISIGTNIRSKKSHPIWAPVVMGDIITFVPSKQK